MRGEIRSETFCLVRQYTNDSLLLSYVKSNWEGNLFFVDFPTFSRRDGGRMRDRGKPARLLLFDVRESFFGWDGRSPLNLPFPLIFSAAYGSFFKKGEKRNFPLARGTRSVAFSTVCRSLKIHRRTDLVLGNVFCKGIAAAVSRCPRPSMEAAAADDPLLTVSLPLLFLVAVYEHLYCTYRNIQTGLSFPKHQGKKTTSENVAPKNINEETTILPK